jgi:hypothetical protein
MITIKVYGQRRKLWREAVLNQPPTIALGDSWEGASYRMSKADYNAQARIIKALDNVDVRMSRADWRRLYNILSYQYRGYKWIGGPRGESIVYRPLPVAWKKFFTELGFGKARAQDGWSG